MAEKDLYAALGVARDAPDDDIRSAYRKLARKYHPDVNPNDPSAEERFKEIAVAHGILSDTAKRKLYDEFGMAGLSDGFDPKQARSYQHWNQGAGQSPFHQDFTSDVNLEDLLSGFFSGSRQARGPTRGRDASSQVWVDFLDAVSGGDVRIRVEGKGALRVTIPAGATEGTRIRLSNQGEPGENGGPPGDLYLTLRVRAHPYFTRDGDNLSVDVPVTVPELILGTSIEVPTPEGPARVNIPPKTPNGRRLRLRGKGATLRQSSGEASRGDLYARLVAQLPESEDPKLDELARELENLYGEENPRQHLSESQ